VTMIFRRIKNLKIRKTISKKYFTPKQMEN
jgi:hypothetical protein